MLSAEQIYALKRLPGIRPEMILSLGRLLESRLDDVALANRIEQIHWTYLNDNNERASLTKAVFLHSLEVAKKTLAEYRTKGIHYFTCYERKGLNIINNKGVLRTPPLIMYYQGDSHLLDTPIITMIGSRAVLDKLREMGFKIAQYFAEKGVTVLSGLALGSDTCAHEGALSVPNGKTIAVVGNGLDCPYPKENKKLYKRIIERGGLILTEYEPGTEVTGRQLIARDFIQAALGQATIVIQCAIDGGTRNASEATALSNKPLFVLYFGDESVDLDSALAGGHDLARRFGAQYLTTENNGKLNEQLITIQHSVFGHLEHEFL